MMPNLTNRVIDCLTLPKSGYSLVWDDKLKGFGLRVRANGRKQYIVQYRNQFGTSRRTTLGEHGIITPIEARKMAQQLLAQVIRGSDPEAEKQSKLTADTVAQLCEQYMEKHAKVKKKASSIKADEWMIRKVVLPKLGTRKVLDITRQDISQLHYAMRETPYNANRMLQLLSKMFNLAEKWGIRPDHSNPVYHVDKFPEKKRERYLSLDEVARLTYYSSKQKQTILEQLQRLVTAASPSLSQSRIKQKSIALFSELETTVATIVPIRAPLTKDDKELDALLEKLSPSKPNLEKELAHYKKLMERTLSIIEDMPTCVLNALELYDEDLEERLKASLCHARDALYLPKPNSKGRKAKLEPRKYIKAVYQTYHKARKVELAKIDRRSFAGKQLMIDFNVLLKAAAPPCFQHGDGLEKTAQRMINTASKKHRTE